MTRREYDDDLWPLVSNDDLRALLWLLVLFAIAFAMCVVAPGEGGR